MTLRWPVQAALLWGLLAGCGQETGILIEVTRDESVPDDLGRLEMYVGIGGIPVDPNRFIDPAPAEAVRLDGRDLAGDPYRLLLRPRDYPDARLMVAAVAYRQGVPAAFGSIAEPVRFVDGEVAMWRIVLTGELPAGFDTTGTNCLTWSDGPGEITIGRDEDKDCDRSPAWEDCDDLDPRVSPDTNEVCGNALDDDCDDDVDENVDEDGDLVTTCDGDCDDADPAISPEAVEVCDGVDNNCDFACDEGLDADGDSITACGSTPMDGRGCLLDPVQLDCDDSDADVSPLLGEVCDGRDNDCDGTCDNADPAIDPDGDGFTACGSTVDLCALSDRYADCDEESAAIQPAATELCNGTDDDCDGAPLQRAPCFAGDPDGGGCFYGERDCAEQPGDPGDWSSDCRPLLDPILNRAPAELCDGYAACDQADDPDPYTCAIAGQPGVPITACGASFQVVGGEQCPGAFLPLPDDGLDACTWVVVGGVSQGDYDVGLASQGSPGDPQPSIDLCSALLVVRMKELGPSSPHVVLLARTDLASGETFHMAVALVGTPAEACPSPVSLECQAPLQP